MSLVDPNFTWTRILQFSLASDGASKHVPFCPVSLLAMQVSLSVHLS